MLRVISFSMVVLGAVGFVQVQESRGAEDTIESSVADATRCTARAATVNFYKEFGVPLDYLGTIGQEICEARLKPDPVGLALAAQGLQVAEEVSGKEASVSSKEVMEDALHLGKLRGKSSELAALKAIVSDEATKADLEKEIQSAKARELEAVAATVALGDGETTKELIGRLTVVNHSGECLRIYVSGYYVGEVHEGHMKSFHVHDHNYHTELAAYCLEDGELVATSCVEGHNHRYTWIIH